MVQVNKIYYSYEAKVDLEEIISYINEHNPKSAKKIFVKIKKTISILKTHKEAGVKKPEITDEPLRFLFCDKYVIAYNPNTNPVEIVRILSGEMDLFNNDLF